MLAKHKAVGSSPIIRFSFTSRALPHDRRLLYVTAIRIKHEELYLIFSGYTDETHPKTELGQQQFFDMDSCGEYPENPDPYYLRLLDGKGWFSVMQNEYKSLYFTNEWWGWEKVWQDWKGKRWVLPKLFAWKDDLPDWITDENDQEYPDVGFQLTFDVIKTESHGM